MKINNVITVSNNGDHWVCLCGNDTMNYGFYPCDKDGQNIEPLKNIWNDLYACLKCGRIIDLNTYEVVSRTNDLSSFGITLSK